MKYYPPTVRKYKMTNERYDLLCHLAEKRLHKRGWKASHQLSGGWTYQTCIDIVSQLNNRTLKNMYAWISVNEIYFTREFKKACVETLKNNEFENAILKTNSN